MARPRISIRRRTIRRSRTPAATSPTRQTSARSTPRCSTAGWGPIPLPSSAGISAPTRRQSSNIFRMKKLWTAAAAAVCLVTFFHAQPRAQRDDDNEAKRVRDATTIFGEIMSAGDKAIPGAILNKATGIAIFPSTIKAGLVVGGMRGRGILSARGANGWSSPAFLTLTGGSFGLQIGGQAADIILVINGQRGLENLVSNQFKIGADAAIAAGPVGRDAQAATDIQLRAQIL